MSQLDRVNKINNLVATLVNSESSLCNDYTSQLDQLNNTGVELYNPPNYANDLKTERTDIISEMSKEKVSICNMANSMQQIVNNLRSTTSSDNSDIDEAVTNINNMIKNLSISSLTFDQAKQHILELTDELNNRKTLLDVYLNFNNTINKEENKFVTMKVDHFLNVFQDDVAGVTDQNIIRDLQNIYNTIQTQKTIMENSLKYINDYVNCIQNMTDKQSAVSCMGLLNRQFTGVTNSELEYFRNLTNNYIINLSDYQKMYETNKTAYDKLVNIPLPDLSSVFKDNNSIIFPTSTPQSTDNPLSTINNLSQSQESDQNQIITLNKLLPTLNDLQKDLTNNISTLNNTINYRTQIVDDLTTKLQEQVDKVKNMQIQYSSQLSNIVSVSGMEPDINANTMDQNEIANQNPDVIKTQIIIEKDKQQNLQKQLDEANNNLTSAVNERNDKQKQLQNTKDQIAVNTQRLNILKDKNNATTEHLAYKTADVSNNIDKTVEVVKSNNDELQNKINTTQNTSKNTNRIEELKKLLHDNNLLYLALKRIQFQNNSLQTANQYIQKNITMFTLLLFIFIIIIAIFIKNHYKKNNVNLTWLSTVS